jgi:preprotein translocase subunit SecD
MATGTAGRVGAVLALVAVSVLVVTAIAVFVGSPRGTPPAGASAGPMASDGLHLVYRVLPVDGVVPGTDDLAHVADVLRARLDATGVAGSSVSPSGEDRVVVDVAVDPVDEAVAAEVRALLGATGRLDFVPLGATPMMEGEVIDLEQSPPLLLGDQIADAAIGSDQTGARTVDFVLGPDGTSRFADHTAAHIGDYIAIALDGRVITAPVIRDTIPDGRVQISMGGVGGYPLEDAQRLVTILRSGPLPFPVEEVPVSP